ncbi:MAG TPA: bifunctional glycosyltransferase/class I SAM-dependent methyltransferase [Polyangiaceae bacterium]
MSVKSDASAKPRLLIFVIAYYAESTLRAVLERIPAEVFETYDCEVLIVDDASEDRTFRIGREYQDEHPEIPMTVLRNVYNQGYGGNQKVGYSYAVKQGFDFVAMVHGDGQYAPEELPRLVAPLREGRADVVFGSRMLEKGAALTGGMPLYKYVGNKILTGLQNFMLGSKLSEFHSGYRIYSVQTLGRIPFLLNSNDFHFDTEIILQLFNARARVLELPIPTYYGDEICRVDGIKYGKNVLLATLENVVHKTGLLYRRRYDPYLHDNSHYDLKLGYASSHTYTLEAVPPGAKVIDIGSGPGGIAQELVKKGCDVTVVDRYLPALGPDGIRVVTQDLDAELGFELADRDVVLLLDVIEHLKDPELFVDRLRARFSHEPKTVVLTTPNIAFLVQRLMLLLGQFNYGKAGILDRTHTRLFTFRSITHLLRDAGFQIEEIRGVPAPFPKVLGNGILGRSAIGANLLLIRLSKTLFSYQIYVRAKTTPDVDFVLREAENQSELNVQRLRSPASARPYRVS